jgi:hypothetical protein
MTVDYDDDEYDGADGADGAEYDASYEEYEPGEPTPGTVLTVEALRLVTSLQDWAKRTAAGAGEASPDGHTGPECQWCPLCQFVAVLRGERPDVTERVVEAGAALATAFRAVLDATAGDHGRGAHRADDHDDDSATAGDDYDDTGRVQHIRLGETFGQD